MVPPAHYIGAIESGQEVVELVDKLLASGAAYVVDDPEASVLRSVMCRARARRRSTRSGR